MNWYYTFNEKVIGPLTGDTMMQLHACGMLTADTQVLKEGTEEWMRFIEAFGKVLVQAEPPTQAEMPETPIKFHCPHCDFKISAELADAGVSVSCPSCGIELVVPTESTRPQEFPSIDSTNRPNSSSHTDSRTSNLAEINRVTPQSPSLPDKFFSENNPARHKFGTTLTSFAKSAAHEVKVNSQIAILKTRIENAKQIELRKVHYALGRKLYEARILLSMQGEIEELERQIMEKGQRALIEENETKGAMLKRFGKNAAKSAESELLSLKLKQSLTHLGELARGAHQETSFPGAETEMESCSAVESKIRNFEDEISSLGALRTQVIPKALPNDVPPPYSNKVVDLEDHSGISADYSDRDANIDHPEYYEETQPTDCTENLPNATSQAVTGESAAEEFQAISRPAKMSGVAPSVPFSLPRLIPLFICCLLFGWVAGDWLMPSRAFVSSSFIGQAIPVAMLAIPALFLAIFGIIYFLRPDRVPWKEAICVLFFTMFIGIISLLIFYELVAHSQEMKLRSYGKATGYVFFMKFIGWASQLAESSNWIKKIFGTIVGVGFLEEATKLLPLCWFALGENDRSPKIGFRSFLIIAFFSGLGFGIGEAIYRYAPWSGSPLVGDNVLRWFACVPSHAIYTVIDAAILWILIPKIKAAENKSEAALLCSSAVVLVAIVHAIYNVFCVIPHIGIMIDAASIFLMYFVVVLIARKSGETLCIQVPGKVISVGILGWLKNHRTGQVRFGRIYVISSALIIFSLVFSSSTDSLATSSRNPAEPPPASRGESQQSEDGFEVQYVSRPIHELYMQGYNNPAAAELSREMLSINPNRVNTVGGMKDKMIVIGADDRLAGLPIRLIAK